MKNAIAHLRAPYAVIVDVSTGKDLFRQSLRVDNAVSKLCAKAAKIGYVVTNARDGKIWL